jgi:hypothetical protein
MKHLVAAASLLFSISAFANPFDAFVGKYTVVDAPKIENKSAAFCDRFSFTQITAFEVAAGSNDPRGTHTLTISNPSGFISNPVYIDWTDLSPVDSSVGSYATTSGTENSASTEVGSFGMEENSRLITMISKNGNGYSLVLIEELLKGSKVKAGCYYQVQLQKQ